MKIYRVGKGWRIGVCPPEGGLPGFRGGKRDIGLLLERVPLEPGKGGGVSRRRADGGVRWLGWYAAVGLPDYMDLLSKMPDAALSLLWLELPPVDEVATLADPGGA